MQPVLVTPRLALRPADAGDVGRLEALLTDPDVRRYLCDDRVLTRPEVQQLLDEGLALAPQGLGLWFVEPAADAPSGSARATLGCAGLLPATAAAACDPRLSGLVEPLVALWPAAWGRGYASESLGALLRHASHTLGLRRVGGAVDVPNEASDRLLRRAGFTVLGEVAGPRHRLRTFVWSPQVQAPAP